METWLSKIFHFQVEKKEIQRPGGKPYFPVQNSGIGVLHTTEGSTVAGAFQTLASKNVAPHFILGEGRIVQCRPIGVQASALRGNPPNPNQQAQIQIEMVGFSKKTLWLPEAGTLKPTIAVMAWCLQNLGIPLRIPNDWPDDLADMAPPWASRNARRRAAEAGLWPQEQGWWEHLEIPWQNPTWHWDCGAMRRSEMLLMAQQLLNEG